MMLNLLWLFVFLDYYAFKDFDINYIGLVAIQRERLVLKEKLMKEF